MYFFLFSLNASGHILYFFYQKFLSHLYFTSDKIMQNKLLYIQY